MSALLPILVPNNEIALQALQTMLNKRFKCSLLQASKHMLQVGEALLAF